MQIVQAQRDEEDKRETQRYVPKPKKSYANDERTYRELLQVKDRIYLKTYEENAIYAQKLQDWNMTIYRGKQWPANYLPPDEYEAAERAED